ncbi:MAG TPA: c-type cytochrome [Cyclobacteriaceae bacterium]|jgi:cytochrome c|nr:c-type cytochrome [Cyclobacteriaceae bacterium]
MKRIFIVIALVGFGAWTLTSCGSKKEESKENTEESADDYQAEKPAAASTEDLIAQGKVLVDASDCKTCHHPINKIIGPAHTDVAKKYEFTQANVTLLADKIIAGGSGVWGQIPMSPHGDVSKADAEKMAMYVLSLDGEKMK